MRNHLSRAREEGASDEEILDTIHWAMRSSANHVKHASYAAMKDCFGKILAPKRRS
jgi:hypothetical protein